MSKTTKSPGMQAGASSTIFDASSLCFSTASALQRQILIARFCLSPWLAQDVSRLCFGEARHG